MRRLSVWLMIAALVLLAVLSWSTPVVFWLYVGLLVPIAAFHWVYACRRCTNVSCALNVASEQFFIGVGMRPLPEDAPEYSDLNAAVAGLPLVFAVGVGVFGAFAHSIVAGVGAVILLAAAFAGYSRVTCTECPNDCPANRNAAYREWKRSGSSA